MKLRFKKQFFMLLFYALIMFYAIPNSFALLCDVNDDSSINIIDALMIAQYYVDLTPAGFIADNADVDCNNSINIIDALIVARCYVGLVPCPTECTGKWEQAKYDQHYVYGP